MNGEFYKDWTGEQLKNFVLYGVTEEEHGDLPDGCEDNSDVWKNITVVDEGARSVNHKRVYQTNVYRFTPTDQYFAIDFTEDNVGYWSGESESYEPEVREVKPVQVSITKWENV